MVEIDEAYGPALSSTLAPHEALLMNIQVDQLNRFFEPGRVFRVLEAIAEATSEPVVLNAAADNLRELSAAGVPFLAVAAGWQLVGERITTPDGTEHEAAGVLPSAAQLVQQRAVGEVYGRSAGESATGAEVAGFENHGAVTTLNGGEPIALLQRGQGTAGLGGAQPLADGTRPEGVRAGVAIGTNLQGPFLPMNPSFAGELLRLALARRGAELPADASDQLVVADRAATAARAALAGRLGLS